MRPSNQMDRNLRLAEVRQRREAARNDRRWFVVPHYTAPEPSDGAEVHNRRGELVATFECFEDAVRCVEAVNREA